MVNIMYYYPIIAVGTIVRTWKDVKIVYSELGIEIEMDETELHDVDEFPSVNREMVLNGNEVKIAIEMMENLDKNDCAGFPYKASDGYYMVGAVLDTSMKPIKEINVERLDKFVEVVKSALPSARVYSWAGSS